MEKSMSNIISKIVIFFTVIIEAIYIAFNINNSNYNTIWILPVVFGICFSIYLYDSIWVRPFVFRWVFLIVSFLRFCVQPILMVINNQYETLAAVYIPSGQQINIAIIIMCYELIVCTVVLKVIDSKRKVKYRGLDKKYEIKLPENKSIYYIFIMVSVVLIALMPVTLNQFTFLIPKGKALNIITENTSVFVELSIMVAIVAKYLIFILAMSKLKEKYNLTNKTLYPYIAIIITILNSCIYYGSNRSQFIFSVIASVILFIYLFPKYKWKLIVPILVVATIILIYITDSRNYYDFYSNITGIKKTLLNLEMTISSYFGGVNYVAIGIETSNMFAYKATMTNLLFDIIRPIVGVNLLLRGIDMNWSNVYFNNTVGLGLYSTMIFPSVAQGYFYFGLLGAPILSVAMIFIVTKLEDILLKNKSIEYVYLFTLVFFRFGTLMGINITIMMNEISVQLLVSSIIILLNKKILIKTKGNNNEIQKKYI